MSALNAPHRARRIAIATPVVHGRDAVGVDTLEMAERLGRLGHDVRVFAESTRGIGQRLAPCRAAPEFARAPDDLLIYHFSFGWPGAVDLLRAARCRRVVKYHNVTPPEFFDGISDAFVVACRAGRDQIGPIAGLGCERYLGDSRYNADELVAAGVDASRVGVVPPYNRFDSILARPADLRSLDRWAGSSTRLLCVGRFAPNKGHVETIEAFGNYRERHDPRASLLLIGKRDPRLARYHERVDAAIARLRLSRAVEIVEDASEPVLKAAYLCADALVVMSRHEGFCVPVAEAMCAGVPVVARAATALTETVGDAGVLVDGEDVAATAAALNTLRVDPLRRRALRVAGEARYRAHYSPPAVTAALVRELELA